MRLPETVAEFKTSDDRLVVLRALRKTDLDAVVRFANTLVREKKTNRELGVVSFDKRLTRKEERNFLRVITEGVRKGEVVSLGAFAEAKMVGHCDVRRRKSGDFRHAGTLGMVILQGYRGVGIGERLMIEVLRQALRKGIWLVELTVFATNEKAIHLYEKGGFRKVGVVPNKFLRDGRHVDEVVMYADLRGSDKSDSTVRGRT